MKELAAGILIGTFLTAGLFDNWGAIIALVFGCLAGSLIADKA